MKQPEFSGINKQLAALKTPSIQHGKILHGRQLLKGASSLEFCGVVGLIFTPHHTVKFGNIGSA